MVALARNLSARRIAAPIDALIGALSGIDSQVGYAYNMKVCIHRRAGSIGSTIYVCMHACIMYVCMYAGADTGFGRGGVPRNFVNDNMWREAPLETPKGSQGEGTEGGPLAPAP